MAIKVELGATENTQQEKPFPKLMKGNKGWIIYAIDKKNVLHIDGPFAGEFSDNFQNIDRDFTDYNHPITLINE